jgi:hypothetical protein
LKKFVRESGDPKPDETGEPKPDETESGDGEGDGS